MRRFFRPCCGSCPCSATTSRQQYKKHVKNVFPKNIEAGPDQPPAQPVNLSSLVHYALSYPEQQVSIARYLQKQMVKELRLNHLQAVRISVLTMHALIDACHTQLPQFEDHIIRMCMVLFEDGRPDMQILACDTFRKMVHYQDEWSDYRKLEAFFPRLVSMCIPVEEKSAVMRLAGIDSLSKMVLFTDSQNTIDHLPVMIPAILANISIDPDSEAHIAKSRGSRKGPPNSSLDSMDPAMTPHNLAMQCLQNIGKLGNLNSTERILLPIFHYLDERSWNPPEFALACIRTAADHSNADHGYGFAYLMLKHLDGIDMQIANPGNNDENEQSQLRRQIQTRIVEVTAELVLTMRLDIGPWQGLINFLLQRLEQASNDELLQNLQEALTNCVAAYCTRLPSSFDYIDLITIVVDQVNNNRINGATISAQKENTGVFLKCALSAAELRKISTTDCFVPDRLIVSLLTLCAPFQENGFPDYFLLVHKTLQNLAIPFEPSSVTSKPSTNRKFGELSENSIRAGNKLMDFLKRTIVGGVQEDMSNLVQDKIYYDRHLKRIFVSIHYHLTGVGTHAEFFQSYFRTMVILLRMYPYASLRETIPLIFHWIDEFKASDGQDLDVKSFRVNFLIGSYILTVSRICTILDARRTASELEEMVSQCSSIKAYGLYWNSELGLCCSDESTSATETEQYTKQHLSFDKNGILRAICRMTFPGIDQQKLRDLLSQPFDSSQAESPRRNSVSLSPAVVVEPSAFINSGSEHSDSERGNESDPLEDDGVNQPDKALSATDVEVVLSNDVQSESENEQTHRQSEHGSQLAALDKFENATRIYRRKTIDRISSVRRIYDIENDQNPDTLENLLRNPSFEETPGRRWRDAVLVSPLSAGKDVCAGLRRESRSSVLMLPDNPEPMLNAQQMLSDLDGADSHEDPGEGISNGSKTLPVPTWKQPRKSRPSPKTALSISVTTDGADQNDVRKDN